MNLLFVFCLAILFLTVAAFSPETNATKKDFVFEPQSGTALDEVVVESSLHIKKKALVRRTRNRDSTVNADSIRVKRHRRRFGSSQSSANAAAQSNFFNSNGDFGASAANAQAQGFESSGNLGSFGASAAGTQTQSFTADRRGGIQGSAGASMSQVYHLPNGKTVNFAISNGFSNGPNGFAGSRGNSLTIN